MAAKFDDKKEMIIYLVVVYTYEYDKLYIFIENHFKTHNCMYIINYNTSLICKYTILIHKKY